MAYSIGITSFRPRNSSARIKDLITEIRVEKPEVIMAEALSRAPVASSIDQGMAS